MEFNESQLVEMISELIGVNGIVTTTEISREKAMRYEEILSRNGFETIVLPVVPDRNSILAGPIVINQYQLTVVRKIKTIEGVAYG